MGLAISMVLLTDSTKVAVAEVQRQLAAKFPSGPPSTAPEQQDGTLSFHLGDCDVIMAEMPAPFPWPDLEGPCATSILWKNAAQEIKPHKRHWIITVTGDLDPVATSTRLTQATAAFMAACPTALGVYWGNAALIVPKNIFIDFAEQVLPHGPPLHIWVDFRVGRDSERTSSGFTHGMTALGHKEFETQQCPEPPGELRERLLALAGYVVENGPVIEDGHTVGEDANERIRVVFSKSAFGHQGQVMRLQYESASPQKPWWKLW